MIPVADASQNAASGQDLDNFNRDPSVLPCKLKIEHNNKIVVILTIIDDGGDIKTQVVLPNPIFNLLLLRNRVIGVAQTSI